MIFRERCPSDISPQLDSDLADRLCSDLGRAKLTSVELGRLLQLFGRLKVGGRLELDQEAVEKFLMEMLREASGLQICL